MKSKADQDWKERLKMEEDKKHNQTRRLEAFRELVEMLDSTETCRHTAFDVALQSVGPREDCKHFCDRCNDPKGLEERAKNRQHRSNFPLLNKFGENDDQLLSYDDDYDLVGELWEAWTTLDSQEESTAEEERPIRGLGWRSGDPDLVAEGYELAQFYHTCGHCDALWATSAEVETAFEPTCEGSSKQSFPTQFQTMHILNWHLSWVRV